MNFKKLMIIRFFITLFVCNVFVNEKAFSQQYILQSNYGGNYEEEVLNVIPSLNNDLIIAGNSKSYPNEPPIGVPAQFYITKISLDGTQSWDVVDGDINELDLLFGGIKTYDDKFLTVGYASYQGTPNQIPGDIRLLKVDTEGNTVYSKLIEYGGVTSAARDICYTTDLNYIIAGERIDSFEWKHYPLLVKINDNGDVIWTKDYKQDTIVGLYKIKQANDGGYYALGTNIVYSSNSVVMRYSEDGEVLWWRDLRDMGEGYDGIEMIYDMEVNSEGNIIMVVNGHFTIFNPVVCDNTPPEFGYLIEMNPEGEIIKQKIFCSNQELPVLYYDLTITDDGGVLLASYNMVLKINTDWETEWLIENIFENVNSYQVKKVGQFPDSSFYAVGEVVMGNNNLDYFVVRIAADGVNSIGHIANNKEFIAIYPNPATTEITVSGYSPAYLKLCDAVGQTVAESKSNKLYVGNLSQGLYVLQLFDAKGQQVKTEKVIVGK